MFLKTSLIAFLVTILLLTASARQWEDWQLEVNSIIEENTVNHWALIVAGSNGWYNYRHQADACHAYQIMKKHGIPDERIIVMMYDDIANNTQNPTPGIVINHPNGKDVYHGVLHDYTREDVTPDNFLKILTGDSEAMQGIGSGKVIKSGPNDHVFVNFADHGAPGIIAFPTDYLHASDLNAAIKEMYQDKKYAEMVFYIEACESGSMFENLLPNNINVFATTAANAEESSYACYYDAKRHTYLGDVYSIKWMEDSDKENLKIETLQKQFTIVKRETNTSHVQEYGQMSMSKDPLSQFQGGKDAEPEYVTPAPLNAVPGPDVPLAILHQTLRDAKTMEEKDRIVKQMDYLLKERELLSSVMRKITAIASKDIKQMSRMLNSKHKLRDHTCYKTALKTFHQSCFNINKVEYALRHLYVLVNMCEEQIPASTITRAMLSVCN